MGYLLKEDVAKNIRKKYKNGYLSEIIGISPTYVSLIFHRKRIIPRRLAYAFTKAINSELEINNLFELIKK